MLATTVVLLVGGTLVIGALEWGNPGTLGALPEGERPLNAAFLSTTLRTAGYTTVDIGALAEPTLFVAMALMFIGGASGSTAGGIKVNTFSAAAGQHRVHGPWDARHDRLTGAGSRRTWSPGPCRWRCCRWPSWFGDRVPRSWSCPTRSS